MLAIPPVYPPFAAAALLAEAVSRKLIAPSGDLPVGDIDRKEIISTGFPGATYYRTTELAQDRIQVRIYSKMSPDSLFEAHIFTGVATYDPQRGWVVEP